MRPTHSLEAPCGSALNTNRILIRPNFTAAGSVARGLAECDEAEAILVREDLDPLDSLLRCRLDFAQPAIVRAVRR